MQIFLLGMVLVSLIGLFYQDYQKLVNDTEALPVDLEPKNWFKHTAVEIVLNLVLFVAFVLKVDLNSLLKAAETVADGAGTFTDVTSIAGAIATAALIHKVVQVTLLPMWNWITGGTTARQNLRNRTARSLNL